MVLPRVLTAVILVPLIIPIVWIGSLPFFIFIFGICLFCWWEFSLMAEEGGYPNQLLMGFAGSTVVLFALYFDGVLPWGSAHQAPSPLFILILWFFLSFLREFLRYDKGHSFLRIITTMTGVLICSFLLGHLLLLRDLRMISGEGFRYVGREITFFLVFVVWAVDVGAWVIGKLTGRFKMAPLLSPAKTWEGALGGTAFALFVGWLFREAFLPNIWSRGEVVFYSLLVAVLAQFSDLIESLIKRSFGVKNSSEILPGHGGIMDRFDSFIFSSPFFYYVLVATGRFQ